MICLLAFAAFGVLYFQNWVVQKPFGIILFVGEGLTAQRTAATRVYIGVFGTVIQSLGGLRGA